jgi:hypothetical protein
MAHAFPIDVAVTSGSGGPTPDDDDYNGVLTPPEDLDETQITLPDRLVAPSLNGGSGRDCPPMSRVDNVILKLRGRVLSKFRVVKIFYIIITH